MNTAQFFDYLERTCISVILASLLLFVCIDFPFYPMISHVVPEMYNAGNRLKLRGTIEWETREYANGVVRRHI